eukprot:CAMPEP_0179434954 /NCGR_PEP_ID=MMETSP0799-20121207/19163_1 /TAXON_ID=46947 /ORGANISM="Geminigera cryophila, Strain CCMP2564" /LENGTH=1005 /DNA_ID=CAMNT_0021214039 /DNA_START=9 /DNA_END=3026 /DNA_ORIENTATION=-
MASEGTADAGGTVKEKEAVWEPLMRDLETEARRRHNAVDMIEASWDPLSAATATKLAKHHQLAHPPSAAPTNVAEEPFDPLSRHIAAHAATDPLSQASDPLSRAAANRTNSSIPGSSGTPKGVGAMYDDEDGSVSGKATFVPWTTRKALIVQNFTTTGTIQMPSFVSVEVAKAGRGANALQARVQAIDDSVEDEVSSVRYNAREYVTHMTALNDELARAWNNEERVKALKMAIECARLLSNTSTPQFYPSLFVLVTEILDTFGRLVFERIKQKGLTPEGKLKMRVQDFGPRDVTEEARETCKNWFYKVASIRELVPRLYMEIAIIRCNQFLYGYAEFDDTLRRLTSMIRGIGDPLLAIYARAYLVRKSHDIDPSLQTPIGHCFSDGVATTRQLASEFWRQSITSETKMEMEAYCELWLPAWDWILHVYGQRASLDDTMGVLREYATMGAPALNTTQQNKTLETTQPKPGGRVVLESILTNLPPAHLSGVAVQLVTLINEEVVRDSKESPNGKSMQLFRLLGKCLLAHAPPEELRRPLLNEIWKHVTNMTDALAYVKIATVYVEYVTKYFGDREINVVLGDVIRHVGKDRSKVELQNPLRDCALGVLRHYSDFVQVVALEAFMPLVDLLQGASQVAVHKEMLRLFNHHPAPGGHDPMIVHTAFSLAKSTHDSIDSMSLDDSRREASELICAFVGKIDFGNDLEQHLNFLVDGRRFLVKLDLVTKALIMWVFQLISKANRKVGMQHTRRTLAFVKACLAFAHVTICAVEDKVWQLYTLQLGGQMALGLGLLSHADSFFKAAINLITDLPTLPSPPTDAALVTIVASYAAVLVVAPGHPEQGPFFLVQGLLNAIREYPWGSQGCLLQCYAHMISLLCALAQAKVPVTYKMDLVEGNDVLFARDSAYVEELREMLEKIVQHVVEALPATKDGAVALMVLNNFLTTAQLSPQAAGQVWEIYAMAKRVCTSSVDRQHLKNTVSYCREVLGEREATKGARLYQELARKMVSR